MNKLILVAIFGVVFSLQPAFAATRFSALDSNTKFQCSPMAEVGCKGLYKVRQNDEVALLSTGRDSLSMRLRSLIYAKQSIRIQALIFTGDESGLRIANILKQKKRENPKMDIRVIVDGVSNPGLQTQRMYADLERHGIEVDGYEPNYLQWINEVSANDPLLPNKRYHDKLWIIDAEGPEPTAIIGGLNIANEYFRVSNGPKNRWRDQDVIMRGAVVADLVIGFERNYAHFKKIKSWRPALLRAPKIGLIPYKQDKSLLKQVAHAEKDTSFELNYTESKVRFFQSRPRFGESYINQVYLSMIREAQNEILIENAYFIPEPDMIQALRAAALRGVKVRILTNGIESNDMPIMADACRYTYKDLMGSDSKVEINEWLAEGTIHAKFAVFDRQVALVGSHNLDPRSKILNSETIVLVESRKLASELADVFMKKDMAKIRTITWDQAVRFHDPSKAAEKFNLFLSTRFRGQL